MQSNIQFVSVVRDQSIYKKFFHENPYLHNYKKNYFDNNSENLGISARYNQFIDSEELLSNFWIVLCHEDFKLNEDLLPKLQELTTENIYCPIGAHLSLDSFEINFRSTKKFPKVSYLGQIIQRNKDGSNKQLIGTFLSEPTPVDCADCCCLIVHSSLIQKYNLRFDENLTFDLYAEDFCINAKEKYGIMTQAIQLDCEHWSGGNVTQRYYDSLKYLNNKYPKSIYSGTCSLIGGKSNAINKQLQDLLAFLRVCSIFKIDILINFIFKVLDSLLPLVQRIIKSKLKK